MYSITQRAERAAIHAANFIKNKHGSRIKQETAALYAKELVLDGATAATAIDKGYRAAMQSHH